jgi:hypothetical protein
MDMGTMMQDYMIGATIRTACAMMLELPVAMLLIIWTYATGKHRLVDSDIAPLKTPSILCGVWGF